MQKTCAELPCSFFMTVARHISYPVLQLRLHGTTNEADILNKKVEMEWPGVFPLIQCDDSMTLPNLGACCVRSAVETKFWFKEGTLTVFAINVEGQHLWDNVNSYISSSIL